MHPYSCAVDDLLYMIEVFAVSVHMYYIQHVYEQLGDQLLYFSLGVLRSCLF